MKTATIAALGRARQTRRPVVLAKNLADLREFLLPDPAAPAALNEAAASALTSGKISTQIIGAETWFIEPHLPPPRLILIGGVHIAQALAPLAQMMGLCAIITDPRRNFASPERFPGFALCHDWPDEALDRLGIDSQTAVVTLTHDPKLDDPALDRALRSQAFYIGSLGSRKTHAARLQRLAALGHSAPALQRVRGPVGLDIGAAAAPEIALSIIAEIVAVRRHGAAALARGAPEPARGLGAAPQSPPRIAALVLAAGRSTRMGHINKLLAPMPDGRCMIVHTVDNVLASGARPVIVITGHQHADIRTALAGKPVRFLHAADYALGLSASLKAGISVIPAEIGGAIICLGDMPLAGPEILRKLLVAYNPEAGQEIIIPMHDGQRGNPVLWGKRFFPEFLNLSGDAGGRQILHRFADFIAEIPAGSDDVLRDFDTPEMLAALSAPVTA
jgi:xanthine dehydrogenase accessory factor